MKTEIEDEEPDRETVGSYTDAVGRAYRAIVDRARKAQEEVNRLTRDQGVVVGARSAWEVTAGLLPGQPDQQFTKRFFLTSADPDEKFAELHKQAIEYAESLIDPSRLNWVRVDWIWF